MESVIYMFVHVLTCAVQSSKKDKKGTKEVKKAADAKQKGKEKEKVGVAMCSVQYVHVP